MENKEYVPKEFGLVSGVLVGPYPRGSGLPIRGFAEGTVNIFCTFGRQEDVIRKLADQGIEGRSADGAFRNSKMNAAGVVSVPDTGVEHVLQVLERTCLVKPGGWEMIDHAKGRIHSL